MSHATVGVAAEAAAATSRSHGQPQRRCACCRTPVLRRHPPFPLDRTMKWCDRCRQQAYNQQRVVQRVATATVTAAAALTLLRESGLAHIQDIVDPLEDDVSPSSCWEEEEQQPRIDTADADGAAAAILVASAEESTAQHDRDLLTRQLLLVQRWAITCQRAELIALRAAWWERCGVSAAIRKGVHWSNLRVLWPRARASQQRHADTMTSPELRRVTESALRRLLLSVGVPHVDSLHCCVMKVLRSPPRAGRQKLHVDVPSSAVVHHPHTRKATGESKAPRCVSIVLHLNPGVTCGTHVPLLSAADMAPLLGCMPRHDEWATVSERLCRESNFASHDMQGGDALVFYTDVPHFGPANPSDTDWRWVLYTMFSPEAGPDQDDTQEFFSISAP
jgi:hypothetical protein